MRLKTEEARYIKEATRQCFGEEAKVYLFGSRADDQKKGGDIDLYIETNATSPLLDKKLAMLQMLYGRLGEQKIDIVINNFTTPLYIHEVARKEGILL